MWKICIAATSFFAKFMIPHSVLRSKFSSANEVRQRFGKGLGDRINDRIIDRMSDSINFLLEKMT